MASTAEEMTTTTEEMTNTTETMTTTTQEMTTMKKITTTEFVKSGRLMLAFSCAFRIFKVLGLTTILFFISTFRSSN